MKRHKEHLESLKETDPEFYEYLQQEDKELLEFDDDDDERTIQRRNKRRTRARKAIPTRKEDQTTKPRNARKRSERNRRTDNPGRR